MLKNDATPYLVRVPGRDAWHVRDGRRRVSTGCDDRPGATRFLLEYVRKKDAGGVGKVVSGSGFSTVSDLLAFWGEKRRRENPASWDNKWKYLIGTIERHAGRLDLSSVDKAWSRKYAAARFREGVADPTVRQELTVVTSAWRLARGERLVDTEPPAFELPAASEAREAWLTREEARRLLEACVYPHLRLFVLIALSTGGRPGAILSLTWEKVDFGGRTIDLRPTGSAERGRRKRAAHVPIEDEVFKALEAAREVSQTEHVIEFKGKKVGSVKKSFATAVDKAGLDPAVVTPHVLRHTAATWLAQAGVDLWIIAGFLGHSDVGMVQRVYGHHHPEHLRSASRALAMK